MLDPETLTAVWDQHADRLLLVARSTGGPAEDAVQEAFVALATQTQLPDDPMADIFGDRDTFTALFLDGSVMTFKKSEMTNERLRAMFTIAAGDAI